jgi:hypothetical protein
VPDGYPEGPNNPFFKTALNTTIKARINFPCLRDKLTLGECATICRTNPPSQTSESSFFAITTIVKTQVANEMFLTEGPEQRKRTTAWWTMCS